MKKNFLYWLSISVLSAFVISCGYYLFQYFPENKRTENLPQIISSVASLLTVIWFTASLYYQNKQLTEQNKQFFLSFKLQKEDSKRNAIEGARNYLNESERLFFERCEYRFCDAMLLLNEYWSIFSILNEIDPKKYLEKLHFINKFEGAFLIMINGFENASRIYFDAIGFPYIVFDRPEEFIVTLKDDIHKIPYFGNYDSSVYFIADIMERLQPGRDAIGICIQVALAMENPKYLIQEKIIEIIEEYKIKYSNTYKLMDIYLSMSTT